MDNTRVFRMAFASVYPHYITKAEKKGRTKEEVHAIIHWLTGYDEQALQQQIFGTSHSCGCTAVWTVRLCLRTNCSGSTTTRVT